MNADTKRYIDSARQVLVGVVPNPASQIDQITNALIYKFMDDMDQAAIKAGGEPSFFVGSLKDYAWTRLMDSKVGNQQRMNLYSEALVKFSEARQLPELFRGIFKSAYLPYRSPEVLDLFLKEINYFDYSHSEELGNAYEYLLSIMSSQGDAGQFRTPRHIIDFIVEVVNPTKDDKVLDPACGTAGFLISAYKHILSQHDGKNLDGTKNSEKPLTPDQRKTLVSNFEGYDIDPGMVRIAQVNMYLHQFKNPKIYQYDSLSSDERWGDKFDVILANPPFMSPKGGIKPHSKFSIQSNRSEVLFVDYIMNHLRPKGRAGIIVPEGIIFQSGKSHTQLRKKLVEDGLCAVVSLPSGVFNPYAGVKTSILFFDNELAKHKKEILFIKIENDGFDLGAQRRPIDKNGLPEAVEIINKWKDGKKVKNRLASYVERTKISENGDYNLSSDHYIVAKDYTNAKWPMVELGEICDVSSGNAAPQDKALFKDGKYPFFRTSDVGAVHLSDNLKDVRDWLNNEGIVGLRLFKKGTILFPKSGASTFLNHRAIMGFDGYVSSHLATITPKDSLINSRYVYQLLVEIDAKSLTPDQAYPSLKTSEIAKIKIPLPPLEIQNQIVEELDIYQKIISGARQVVENWKPRIDIDPKWERVKFGDNKILQIIDGDRGANYPSKEEFKESGYCLFLNTSNVRKGEFSFNKCDFISQERDEKLRKGKLRREDIVLTTRGTLGNTAHYSTDIKFEHIRINSGMVILRSNLEQMDPKFLLLFLNSFNFKSQVENFMSGSAQPQLPIGSLSQVEISIPPIKLQKDIVKKAETEYSLVDANKKLVDIYDQKIKDVVAKLWEK